jgi:cell division protein FtsQ
VKILKKIWWFPLIVYLIVMPSFISGKVYNESCKSIRIEIVDSAQYSFIRSADIFSMVHNDESLILGNPIDDIEIGEVEARIKSLRELKSVEVYRTADGNLHIEADQRDPVVRIITSFGNSYYLDFEGEIIPHNSMFTPRVTVVSGNISIPDNSIAEGNIRSLPDSDPMKKVLKLVNLISERELWLGQIEQLYINNDGNIDIIPRVGNHIVKMGQFEGFEKKLDYLEKLYIEAMPLAGWNRYKEINLMYEGQIVCIKR